MKKKRNEFKILGNICLIVVCVEFLMAFFPTGRELFSFSLWNIAVVLWLVCTILSSIEKRKELELRAIEENGQSLKEESIIPIIIIMLLAGSTILTLFYKVYSNLFFILLTILVVLIIFFKIKLPNNIILNIIMNIIIALIIGFWGFILSFVVACMTCKLD